MKEEKPTMNRKKLTNLILTGSALTTLWICRQPLIASLQWFRDLDAVTTSIRGYGLWGPVVLCVLFILQTFLAFIPGQALMVASGYVYGFSGGILITWVSLVLGGQLVFWLARRYGRPFAEKWISPFVLDRWDKTAANQSITFLCSRTRYALLPKRCHVLCSRPWENVESSFPCRQYPRAWDCQFSNRCCWRIR